MSLDQIAALAEIIAAVAVILSLLFVGLQIRDGNRQAKADALQNALNSEIQLSVILAEHADTWDKVVKGEVIEDGAELRKAIHLYNILMSDTENRFHQHKQGFLKQESWENKLRTLKETNRLPVYQAWRSSLSGQNHSDEFLLLLDGLANN